MPFEQRGNHRYFYRCVRIDGVPRKIYIGRGEAAERAAQEIAAAKDRRESDQAAAAEIVIRVASAEGLTLELDQVVGLLMEGSLLTCGVRRRRGQWRRGWA